MQTNNWNWLKLIAIGRILSALTFFMYVGSIQQLITVWELSATEAGLIQTSLVIGFAIALFISSYCSDFYNPNRILSIYLVINFLSSFVFYLIIDKAIDEQLGFVGDPKKIDTKILNNFFKQKIIPVIAPMGMDNKGQVYNVNADTAAGTIANQIKAERLLLMTDVPGVNDKNGNLISQLSTKQALDLIDNGTITGGMIPKIKTCISAIESGVNGVVIIDGRKSHAVLFELFSNLGAGTLIVK